MSMPYTGNNQKGKYIESEDALKWESFHITSNQASMEHIKKSHSLSAKGAVEYFSNKGR